MTVPRLKKLHLNTGMLMQNETILLLLINSKGSTKTSVKFDPFMNLTMEIPQIKVDFSLYLSEAGKPLRLVRFSMYPTSALADVRDMVSDIYDLEQRMLEFGILRDRFEIDRFGCPSGTVQDYLPFAGESPRLILFSSIPDSRYICISQLAQCASTPFPCDRDSYSSATDSEDDYTYYEQRFGWPIVISVPDKKYSCDSLYDTIFEKLIDAGLILDTALEKMSLCNEKVFQVCTDINVDLDESTMFCLPDELMSMSLIWTGTDVRDDYLKLDVLGQLLRGHYDPPSPHSVTLNECIEEHLREEEIDEWYCGRCKEHTHGLKKLDLWKLPEILIVHLKRFVLHPRLQIWTKLESVVDFPLDQFQIGKFSVCKNEEFKSYELFSVSNHIGGTERGHYTAFCKRMGKWYQFDDEVVEAVEDHRVSSKWGYVLFFRLKQDDLSSSSSSLESVLTDTEESSDVPITSLLAKLKLFGGKTKEITLLLDEATAESLKRVDWAKAKQAVSLASSTNSGPETVISLLLDKLTKGPIQQTYSLYVIHWLLQHQNTAFYAKLCDAGNLDRLFDIWVSKDFSPESKVLLAAIVDQIPSFRDQVLEKNLLDLRSKAAERDLMGGYEAEFIFFDLPETGLTSLADLQSIRMAEVMSQPIINIPAHYTVQQQQPQPFVRQYYTSPQSQPPPQGRRSSLVAQQPQILILDYAAHVQVVLSNASMLIEAINFADHSNALNQNTIVQEFRNNCISLRQTTNQFLQQGALTEAAIAALVDCNDKLSDAFRVYDEALERQLVQRAIEQSRTGKEPTPKDTALDSAQEAQEAEQLRIALEQSRIQVLRSPNALWELPSEIPDAKDKSQIGSSSSSSAPIPYTIGGSTSLLPTPVASASNHSKGNNESSTNTANKNDIYDLISFK
ncbi:hypothetical protein BASA62_007314 [Batrachochytrium salamandrivorans]|nr:hypothetical protein BASA62_007314 [Batrachochytrium salamandrivorans]